MNNSTHYSEADTNNDAASWRELVLLLQRKAYKPTITPEEIAAELPDLREVYRNLRLGASDSSRPYRQ